MQQKVKTDSSRHPHAPTGGSVNNPAYRTKRGVMYCADTAKLLASKRFTRTYKGKIQLILTSPPFPLHDQKRYGNLNGPAYVEWLARFAPLFRELLTPDGSIALEIGNSWQPRKPVMSTVVIEALLRFLKEGRFHLCKEFIWYNPAKLPSPAQWVSVERIRVKDAFTRIWWMSPNERPKADNRRVLREYSESMRQLINTGRYNAGVRPSAHRVGQKSFARDNGGAIPPSVINGDEAHSLSNLLKAANTRSRDQYQLFCRANGLPLHPARMPSEVAEFFIKFLAEPGDIVFDPFAGSNTTGEMAQSLRRRWVGAEIDPAFASTSASRFNGSIIPRG
jgi:hypothetical protein